MNDAIQNDFRLVFLSHFPARSEDSGLRILEVHSTMPIYDARGEKLLTAEELKPSLAEIEGPELGSY